MTADWVPRCRRIRPSHRCSPVSLHVPASWHGSRATRRSRRCSPSPSLMGVVSAAMPQRPPRSSPSASPSGRRDRRTAVPVFSRGVDDDTHRRRRRGVDQRPEEGSQHGANTFVPDHGAGGVITRRRRRSTFRRQCPSPDGRIVLLCAGRVAGWLSQAAGSVASHRGCARRRVAHRRCRARPACRSGAQRARMPTAHSSPARSAMRRAAEWASTRSSPRASSSCRRCFSRLHRHAYRRRRRCADHGRHRRNGRPQLHHRRG